MFDDLLKLFPVGVRVLERMVGGRKVYYSLNKERTEISVYV